MPGIENFGRALLALGLAIAALGLLLTFAGKLPLVGRLPGDILIQRDNVSCFFPLATMLILSAVLTLVLNLVSWFLRR